MNTENKRYLGDGVYVQFDGWMIRLTTEDGAEVTNVICMENEVLSAFLAYIRELKGL
jgi:hypothetical protein